MPPRWVFGCLARRLPSGATFAWRLDVAERRDAFIDDYKSRCDPTFARKDIFADCPWVAELSRASPGELRDALLRVRKHRAPADASGLEDALGQGSEVPSDGTTSLSTTAPFSGAGAAAEHVAMDSVDRIHLSCATHMKSKFSLRNGAHALGRALEYFRRVAEETDSSSVRAGVNRCEFFRESARVLFTPYVAAGRGLRLPGSSPRRNVGRIGRPSHASPYGQGRSSGGGPVVTCVR